MIVVDNARPTTARPRCASASRPSRCGCCRATPGQRHATSASLSPPRLTSRSATTIPGGEPGALARAETALDADSRLGLVAAHTLTGLAREPDPVNALMARSPLRDGGRPRGARLPGLRLRGAEGGVPARLRVQPAAVLHRRGAAAQLRPGRRGLGPALPPGRDRGARAIRGLPGSHLRRRAERRNLVLTAWLRLALPRWRWPRRCAWPWTPPATPMTVPRWPGRGPETARGAAVPAQASPGDRAESAGAGRGPGRPVGATCPDPGQHSLRATGHRGHHHQEPAARTGAHVAADDRAAGPPAGHRGGQCLG